MRRKQKDLYFEIMEDFKISSLFGTDSSDSTGVQPSSLPLVLPNNVEYDSSTGRLTHLPRVKRTHLVIVKQTVAVLSKVRDPIAVVSIAGMARSGKSYILSRLLGSSDIFKLGHSMDPETVGIWIGTQVLKKDDFTILLVDTEGLDAASAEKKNDISLLVLTILLSSYFIFNTLSVPKQTQLEELQCFVQLANSLRVSREGSGDYNKFSSVFPAFLWLLRDVTLTPTDAQGKETDARTFLLERVLKASDGFEETASDKVARALKTFFPSIDCITLPPPSDDAVIMQNITVNEDKLSPQFKTTTERVIEHIFTNVKPKTGYAKGSQVTGTQLASMLETYVDAINDPSTIPVMETSWETSLRLLIERFFNEALELYKEGMDQTLADCGEEPLETNGDGTTLVSLHRKYYTSTQEHLRKGVRPICTEAQISQCMSRLQQAVFGNKGKNGETENQSGFFHEYWRINNEKSIKYCEQLRHRLWEAISQKILKADNTGYTYKNLQDDLKRFELDYRANAKGPAKEKVYSDFLGFVKSEEKAFSKIQDFKQEEFQERQNALEINSRLEDIQEEQRRVEAMMVDEMEEHKREATRLNKDYNDRIDKMKKEEKDAYIQRMRELREVMESRMAMNVKILQEMTTKNMKFIEDNVKLAREEAAEKQQQMVEIIKQVQERNDRIAQELAAQAAAQSAGPLEALMDFLPVLNKFGNLVKLFGAKKTNPTSRM